MSPPAGVPARSRKNWRVALAVGDRIALERAHAGYTQAELADRSRGWLAPQLIANYEKGHCCPSVERLIRIADALSCDVSDLIPTIREIESVTTERAGLE